ncbi:MAG: sirohydrochlorin cobaltochelatase [Actinomycetota bacterium]|nr:sirohydrochlorin cobaltochelatase [Actinomycetota bacterium]
MNNPSLLVIGHGTRRPRGVEEFLELVDRIRLRAAGQVSRIEGGLIELARPTVSDGVARLLDEASASVGGPRPPRRIIAVPLLLGTAGHLRSDIPALLAVEQDRHPGLTFGLASALGPHPILRELLRERIDTALEGAGRPGTSVVLVGRGTTDPQANADVAAVTRLLWEGSGLDCVELSFVAVTAPSLPQSLERLRRVGARRIVVLPYLLFEGLLSEQIAAETAQFAAENPELDLRVAGLLGESDQLADLVLHRYRQARALTDPSALTAPPLPLQTEPASWGTPGLL